jgi:hypothetical protein
LNFADRAEADIQGRFEQNYDCSTLSPSARVEKQSKATASK